MILGDLGRVQYADLTDTQPVAQFGYVKGDYNNNVVIVSGQLTWSF